jgi:protoporphyrinogen oxidase
MKKIGIIGAGPSGLAMAQFLQAKTQIFEKSQSPGGHAGSFTDEGYTFDHGPHILFSKDKAILQYLINLLGENIHVIRGGRQGYLHGVRA